MMKALLVAGAASVAFAQCYLQSQSNCTAAMNCTWTAPSCYRKNLMNPCNTLPTCNTTDGCKTGSGQPNSMTCVQCDDACAGSDNTTCSANAACGWAPGRCSDNTPMMLPGCLAGMGSKAACTGMDGCFWLSITETICGMSVPINQCIACNSTDVVIRSAIANFKGQTCTWAKMGSFAQDFKATMTEVAQATGCSDLLPANRTSDMMVLSSPLVRPFFQNSYDASAAPQCTGAAGPSKNGAASVVPGVAFLVAVALM